MGLDRVVEGVRFPPIDTDAGHPEPCKLCSVIPWRLAGVVKYQQGENVQQKQGVIASPVGVNMAIEVFEDAKMALDSLMSRFGGLYGDSKTAARFIIEGRTLNQRGEKFSFSNDVDGGKTTYFLIPATINVK
jgi:hypothetical protein